MWNAFAGYRDIYGKEPSAREVRHVRLWLAAVGEYEAEQHQEQQRQIDEANRKAELLKQQQNRR